MPKPRIDYEATRQFILVMMYEAFLADQNMKFDIARIRQQLLIPANVVQVSLEKLERDGLVAEVGREETRATGVLGNHTTRHWIGTGRYELTDDGRTQVEKLSDEKYDMATIALSSGQARTVFQADMAPEVPAAPDRWEPLSIEPGDPKAAAARDALDKVAGLVAQDNGYKVEHPAERAEVLAGLRGASTIFMEAGQFSYSNFIVYVVWPLERVMARFNSETLIGAAAQLLKEALKEWAKAKVGDAIDKVLK